MAAASWTRSRKIPPHFSLCLSLAQMTGALRATLIAVCAATLILSDYLITLTSPDACPDINAPASSPFAFVQYPTGCLTDGPPPFGSGLSGGVRCVNASIYTFVTYNNTFCSGSPIEYGANQTTRSCKRAPGSNNFSAEYCWAGTYTPPASAVVVNRWDIGGYYEECIPPAGIPAMILTAIAPGVCAPSPYFVAEDGFARISCAGNNSVQAIHYANEDCSDSGNASTIPLPLCTFNPTRNSDRAQVLCSASPPAPAASASPTSAPAASSPTSAPAAGVAAAVVCGIGAAAIAAAFAVKRSRDAIVSRLSCQARNKYKSVPPVDSTTSLATAYETYDSASFQKKP